MEYDNYSYILCTLHKSELPRFIDAVNRHFKLSWSLEKFCEYFPHETDTAMVTFKWQMQDIYILQLNHEYDIEARFQI